MGPVRSFDLRAVVAGLATLVAASVAHAQELKVVGLDGRAQTLTPAELAAMPHADLTVTVEGKTEAYRGVPLSALLARLDAPLGKALRGPELRDVVLVTAKDGYGAALSLAEADPMERKEQVILADQADGKPLGEGRGPYRLVIEGDLRGARLVRMVDTIELRRVGAER
jgi:DMSO/TMAO reductase YedYZ molybdopterin-dependent catalytic subunit